ncbi:MAG: hypothetical protein Q9209_000970 [Squamulea sp. 1 TL-2023]
MRETAQANGEHELSNQIAQLHPSQKPLPQKAPSRSLSVESIDVAEWCEVKTLKKESTEAMNERLLTNQKSLACPAGSSAATTSVKATAYTPALPIRTTYTSKPKKEKSSSDGFLYSGQYAFTRFIQAKIRAKGDYRL